MRASPERNDTPMRRALDLARRGEGLTRPNPPVGAVVVKGGRIAGEGWHRKAGGPHAEIFALRQAGRRARGATLYVTLEPCSTFGRTPPCTEAILRAGIKTVVIASRDPNPRNGGRGISTLRRQGLNIVMGVLEAEGDALVRPFRSWIARGRPLVTLKLGISLDGCIADRQGTSRWITGRKARDVVHDLRRRVDAIMVGAGTVIADNPRLAPRPARGRQPWRVIVDGRGRAPLTARVFRDRMRDRTILATTGACPRRVVRALVKRGVTVLQYPSRDARVPMRSLLKKLGSMGCLHVLCEGGGELAEALAKAGLADEYLFFVAPKLIGGRAAVRSIGGEGWPLRSAPRLRFESVERMGDDVMIRAVNAE